MKIAVFGLGYVGMVNMACFAKLGHHIVGCDIKPHKVDLVNARQSPIYEPGLDELLSAAHDRQLISATTSVQQAVSSTQLALICVGTPSRSDGTVNLEYALSTTRGIAAQLKQRSEPYTLVYRSTIPPGTIEEKILPELRSALGDEFEKLSVVFVPEFLREGSAVKDFFHCSRIVIGTGGKCEEAGQLFSYSSDIPLVITDYRTAEFVKYVDNAFHALKIAFVNEVYQIGAAHGAEVETANQIFLMDRHLNIAPTYLRPGLPYGGSCLPKDLRAIQHLAGLKQLKAPLLHSIATSNELLQQRMFQLIETTGRKKVTLYGLTFKSGTDDVRESPMARLAHLLIQKGYGLHIYDPDIRAATLPDADTTLLPFVKHTPEEAFAKTELVAVCKKDFAPLLKHLPAEALICNFYDQQVFGTPHTQQRLYQ